VVCLVVDRVCGECVEIDDPAFQALLGRHLALPVGWADAVGASKSGASLAVYSQGSSWLPSALEVDDFRNRNRNRNGTCQAE